MFYNSVTIIERARHVRHARQDTYCNLNKKVIHKLTKLIEATGNQSDTCTCILTKQNDC